MALQLSSAVTDGLRRVASLTGAVLFVGTLVVQFGILASINTVLAAVTPVAAGDALGLTLPVPAPVAAAVGAVAVVANLAFLVAITRGLARPRAALSTLPASLFTRRAVRASLTLLVAGAIVLLLTTVGFAFLILPGLYLSAAFLFVVFVISVEDRGVVDALGRSWSLSSGNRLRLLAIVVVSGAGGLVVGVASSLAQLAGVPVVGDVVTVGFNAVLSTVLLAVTAAAYRQVADPDAGGDPAAGTGTPPAGASATPDD